MGIAQQRKSWMTAAGKPEEYLAVRRKLRDIFLPVSIFSAFANILGLSGSLYMLQVYDRVLLSHSLETLSFLTLMLVVAYCAMGLLDYVRTGLLARAGARFQALMDPRIFQISLSRPDRGDRAGNNRTAPQDVETIQRLLAGPALVAVFDAPWLPAHLILMFWIHWALGTLALVSALVLGTVAALTEISSRDTHDEIRKLAIRTGLAEQSLRQDIDSLHALGMGRTARTRWLALRAEMQKLQMRLVDHAGGYAVLSRYIRQLVLSLALGLGALLAIRGELSQGTIIACSILLGRTLQPIDILIGNWSNITKARKALANILLVLKESPTPEARLPLPAPQGKLQLDAMVCIPPGSERPALRGITLTLEPGQALGVIGASASGKTTLAKVIAGAWRPTGGAVRLDGAALDQWPEDELGRHVGYLPQEISLMEGTVADNIARFTLEENRDANAIKVADAAMRAGAHEMILTLPQGYNTPVGFAGAFLSGGQRQRIGLARALYDNPPLVVLDEPNAHLDAEGEAALHNAILDARTRGAAVVVMAHRPAAINACDQILVLDQGRQARFGPKDAILKDNVHPIQRQNATTAEIAG